MIIHLKVFFIVLMWLNSAPIVPSDTLFSSILSSGMVSADLSLSDSFFFLKGLGLIPMRRHLQLYRKLSIPS